MLENLSWRIALHFHQLLLDIVKVYIFFRNNSGNWLFFGNFISLRRPTFGCKALISCLRYCLNLLYDPNISLNYQCSIWNCLLWHFFQFLCHSRDIFCCLIMQAYKLNMNCWELTHFRFNLGHSPNNLLHRRSELRNFWQHIIMQVSYQWQ